MINLIPGAFAKAYNIEPMSTPVLPIAGRREQAIDQSFVCFWGFIAHERDSFLRRRRQTRQVARHTPNKRVTISRRIWLQSRGGKPCVNKTIDWIATPLRWSVSGRRFDRRQRAQ